MKKIFLIAGLFVCMLSAGQSDSVQWYAIPVDNTVPTAADFIYTYISGSDTIIRRVQRNYLMPWTFNSPNIHPRLSLQNVILGGTIQPGLLNPYKLVVYGKSYFSDDMSCETKIKFGNAYITLSGSDLAFYSPATGLKTLTTLSGLTAASNYRNGITLNDGYGEFGGTLIKNTSISLGGYSLTFGLSSNYLQLNESSGNNRLNASGTLTLYGAADIVLGNATSFQLRSNGSGKATFQDLSSNPVGLRWYTDYYDNIKNNSDSLALITWYSVMRMLREYGDTTTAGGGGIGKYVADSKDGKDTVWLPVITSNVPNFDGNDTTDFIPIIPDSVLTLTDSTVTVDITYHKKIIVNDGENCAIFGFDGGEIGDIINVANITTNNLILKDNSTGTQKIMNGADVTITGYGGAVLMFTGTYWMIIGLNQ